MRKILKISYGGITKKVVATLGLTAFVITLFSIYSCSSDGEYDEPWLNQEHKTRSSNPNSGLYMIEAGHVGQTIEDARLRAELYLEWDDAVDAHNLPKARVNGELSHFTKKDSTITYNELQEFDIHIMTGSPGYDYAWIEARFKYYNGTEQVLGSDIPIPRDKIYVCP